MSGGVARAQRTETGAITPFILIVSIGILMLGGLVVDGGRQLNARGLAVAYAQEAARAGAQAIDVTSPTLDVLEGRAVDSANNFCASARAADPTLIQCRASVTTETTDGKTFRLVQVDTRVEIDTIVLGMIGMQRLDAEGGALARPIRGIADAEDGLLTDSLPDPQSADVESEGPPAPPPPGTVPECQPVPTATPTPAPTSDVPGATPTPTASPTPSPTPTPASTLPPCPPAEG